MSSRIERLAERLAAAWRSGGTTPLPAAGKAPHNRTEAYALQDRTAELIDGEIVGWIVGATVRAVRVFEGRDGPLPVRILADRCLESPAGLPARLVHGANVECECAMRLTRDLPGSSAPIEPAALAGMLTFHPAIELAAKRYAPGTAIAPPRPSTPSTIRRSASP